MEGVYSSRRGPAILINSERPSGRQSFTCAHEFGHHVFNHGSHIDEIDYKSDSDSEEEFLADAFAGYLLLPKIALCHALSVRRWRIETLSPIQLYELANYFGVGYASLVHHMTSSLNILTQLQRRRFLSIAPAKIKSALSGRIPPADLISVDTNWTGRPVDVQVDDIILVPHGTKFEGNCVSCDPSDGTRSLLTVVKPGLGRLELKDKGWAVYVRASRKHYEGLSKYRHCEEVADD
jgi:hypothetical protein